jgi:isoprenylcysteine carboxyl methyltransferase (ICMT) family protein YpbQ
VFFYRFDVLISKIIFFKKKTLFWCISKWKTLWNATLIILSNRQ